jgi:MFS family permease
MGEGLFNVALFSYLGGLSKTYRGTFTGLAASLFGIGHAIAPSVIGLIIGISGSWRGPFLVFGSAGLVGAAWIIWLLNDSREKDGLSSSVFAVGRLPQVFKPRNLAVCAVIACQGFCGYAYISIVGTYLREQQGMPAASAGLVFGAMGVGAIFGGAPMGFIADKLGRKLYLVVATLTAAISATLIFNISTALWLTIALSFLFGLAGNSIYANCYALIHDQVEKLLAPLAVGVLATIYFLPASVSGYVLPAAAAHLGWEGASLLVFGGSYGIAFLVMLALIWAGPGRDINLDEPSNRIPR